MATFTALPREKWAEIRERMKQSEVNKSSLRLIDSSAVVLVLDKFEMDKEAYCAVRSNPYRSVTVLIFMQYTVYRLMYMYIPACMHTRVL